MYGRQVTKKDLATLVQQMDSNMDFDSAVELVDKLLAQHPDGDTQAVRKILEFEMIEALMESEVRDEQDLLIESLVNLLRLDNADPDEVLGNFPENIQQAVRSRMQFEDEFASDYEHPMSNMPYGHPRQEEYETYVEEWDGYDDELLSFEEWLEQEEEYDRQLQEYEDSDEYAEAIEDFDADDYAGDYMVQSDVARIMDSAARLAMMTPPDETYSEWWKSQLSVVADKIDGLADYLEDRYADETDGMDAETFEASRGNRGHQMMTKELSSKIPKLYSQEEVSDPTVVAHYFTPYGRGDWFVIEWDGEDMMYGLADLGYPELGYFSLSELESAYRGSLPLVERDLYWTPVPLSEVRKTRMDSEEDSTPIQRPMDFGEPVNWTPHDGTPSLRKRKRAENEPVPAADYEFYYRSLLE
jgi:hypothetical protein